MLHEQLLIPIADIISTFAARCAADSATISNASFARRRVESVLIEMSIHQHEECWAPWDVNACRNSMAGSPDFAKAGMINIFVADSEEPFYMKSINNPLYEDFSLKTGSSVVRQVLALTIGGLANMDRTFM